MAELPQEVTQTEGARFDASRGTVRFLAGDPLHWASEATGGLDHSCHRCLLALAAFCLLVGVSASVVGCRPGGESDVLRFLGYGMLGVAGLAVLAAWAAWRVGRWGKLCRRESVEDLVAEAN